MSALNTPDTSTKVQQKLLNSCRNPCLSSLCHNDLCDHRTELRNNGELKFVPQSATEPGQEPGSELELAHELEQQQPGPQRDQLVDTP